MPTFTPRTRRVPLDTKDFLWSRTRIDVPVAAVLKFGDSYQEYAVPTAELIEAADVTYLGGHTYTISADEATALTAAGYTVEA